MSDATRNQRLLPHLLPPPEIIIPDAEWSSIRREADQLWWEFNRRRNPNTPPPNFAEAVRRRGAEYQSFLSWLRARADGVWRNQRAAGTGIGSEVAILLAIGLADAFYKEMFGNDPERGGVFGTEIRYGNEGLAGLTGQVLSQLPRGIPSPAERARNLDAVTRETAGLIDDSFRALAYQGFRFVESNNIEDFRMTEQILRAISTPAAEGVFYRFYPELYQSGASFAAAQIAQAYTSVGGRFGDTDPSPAVDRLLAVRGSMGGPQLLQARAALIQLLVEEGRLRVVPIPKGFGASSVKLGKGNYATTLSGRNIDYFATAAQAESAAKKLNTVLRWLVTRSTQVPLTSFGDAINQFIFSASNPANGFVPTINIGG